MAKTSLDFFEEQIFFTTVRIVSKNDDGKGSSVGTGFIYQLPVSDKRAVLLLISNKHVLKGSKNLELLFHKRLKTKNAPKLGETVGFTIKELGSLYFEHPDSGVDLACINISGAANDKENQIFYKNLHKKLLPTEENAFHAGATVWFIGYPENRFDVQNNLPILRAGTIASIPAVDFNGNKQFIIDAQVFPGSSGSPVFAPFGGEVKLVGVVSQTMIRNNEVQTVPTRMSIVSEEVLGLGIVVKSQLLEGLFNVVATSKNYKSETVQKKSK